MNTNLFKNMSEKEILETPNILNYINNLLRVRQFSEEFLIKTRNYYNANVCIKTQNNLSPEFCFKYLYDNDVDSEENKLDFNDISNYLKRNNYSNENINNEFKKLVI